MRRPPGFKRRRPWTRKREPASTRHPMLRRAGCGNAGVGMPLANQKILLAYAEDNPTGVTKIEEIAAGIGKSSMLAVDPDGLRTGVGRTLVPESEAWGRAMGFAEMEIRIVRAEIPNPHKQILHEWYTRLGYIEQETYSVAERIPEIASLQRLSCVSTFYRKPLD
jgi:GNAT superfamily N-acetyltransferase